jgi:peptidyl-prolyl cis-trans isomerase C
MTLFSFTRRPSSHGAFLRHGSVLAMVAALALLAAPIAQAQQAAPSPQGAQQQGDPVLAKVQGTEIRASDLAIAEEDLGSNLPPQNAPDAKRDYLITFMGDMLLLAKAAEAKKLADTDDFKRRLAYARTKLLMEQLLAAEAKTAITEAAMRKVYDEAIASQKKEQEVRARHILVETEDEAKNVLAELKKGADFAELAKTKSKDPGSADGGDLGYFTKDQMVPEFAEVAFKLDKGQLSDPVKTQFGWHVIRVEDKRERQPPEFDKVKDQLEQYLARRSQAELITKLRAEGKVERMTPPAAPATPAAPPAEQKKN